MVVRLTVKEDGAWRLERYKQIPYYRAYSVMLLLTELYRFTHMSYLSKTS